MSRMLRPCMLRHRVAYRPTILCRQRRMGAIQLQTPIQARHLTRTPSNPITRPPSSRDGGSRESRSSAIYKGWDVHAYTSDFKSVLDEFYYHDNTLDHNTARQLVYSIQDALHQRRLATPQVVSALHKMLTRHYATARGYRDTQLRDLNVMALLRAFYHLVRRHDDESGWQMLAEALHDTHTTCTQGDSHRLAAWYIALKRSMVQS